MKAASPVGQEESSVQPYSGWPRPDARPPGIGFSTVRPAAPAAGGQVTNPVTGRVRLHRASVSPSPSGPPSSVYDEAPSMWS